MKIEKGSMFRAEGIHNKSKIIKLYKLKHHSEF